MVGCVEVYRQCFDNISLVTRQDEMCVYFQGPISAS